jgi:hypothetical protein
MAKKAVWFYYECVGAEQFDQEMGSKTIETGYKECEEEATSVYQQAVRNLRS